MLPGTYTFTGTIKTQIFRQPKWDQHSVKCNITESTSRTLSKMIMLQFTNHWNIPKQECMSYQVTCSQPNKTKAVVFRWQKKESRLNRCVQNVTRLIISWLQQVLHLHRVLVAIAGSTRTKIQHRLDTAFFQWKDNYMEEQPGQRHCIGW